MRTWLILIVTIILIINAQALNGQADSCCNYIDKLTYEPGLSGEISALPFDTVTNFNKDWLLGDIFLVDGGIIRNKYIKYNGLLDELFWIEPKSGKTVKLDKEAIMQFHFQDVQGDTSVYFRKIKVKQDILTDSSETYGQVIYEGNLSLFVLHTFRLIRTELTRRNGILFENGIHEEEPVYILKFKNIKTSGYKNLNRKNLYAFAPEKKDQIKRFFKQAKLFRMQNYADIIMLMKFLNSILD
jgi:hypothetical protein